MRFSGAFGINVSSAIYSVCPRCHHVSNPKKAKTTVGHRKRAPRRPHGPTCTSSAITIATGKTSPTTRKPTDIAAKNTAAHSHPSCCLRRARVKASTLQVMAVRNGTSVMKV